MFNLHVENLKNHKNISGVSYLGTVFLYDISSIETMIDMARNTFAVICMA